MGKTENNMRKNGNKTVINSKKGLQLRAPSAIMYLAIV